MKYFINKITTSNLAAIIVIILIATITVLVLYKAPDHLSEMLIAVTSLGTTAGTYLFKQQKSEPSTGNTTQDNDDKSAKFVEIPEKTAEQ